MADEAEATPVLAADAAEPADLSDISAEVKGDEAKDAIHWVIEADAVRPILFGEGKAESEAAETMFQVFKRTVEAHGSETAYTDAEGNPETWQGYYDSCVLFAKSCIAIGVEPFQAVNMIGFNAPAYFIANTGGIMAGAIAAGIYTTNDPEACHYVSSHCEAAVVVCEGPRQLEKYYAIYDRLPSLKALVMYGGGDIPPAPEGCDIAVHSFEDFMGLGVQAEVTTEQVEERMAAQEPGNCCTLIYTSGTTGNPKAVMLSHDNITWTARRLRDDLEMTIADRMVSYLPLNHIAAQMLDIHAPMAYGYQIFFARPDALKGTLKQTLLAAQPTVFFGVPRVWEKFQEAMRAAGAATTGCKLKLVKWAKGKGGEYAEALQYGGSGNTPSCFGCAHSLVLSKVKAALGFTHLRLAYTGAAPIHLETLQFFGNLNINIMEVFGQSETSGPASINFPGQWKMGSCGPILKGTELVIVPETKEIIYKGRHIFMGYLHSEEATQEAFDDRGYLHSGDQGAIDDDGFLRIIGRIKELIVTAGGENIPPVLIEDALKEALPAVSNACVIGDRRKYLTVLLALKTEIDEEGVPSDALTAEALAVSTEIGSDARTVPEAMECEKWAEYLQNGLTEANKKATSRAQRVQKFTILPVDFSVGGGELTATLKTRRKVVHEKYEEAIEAMYAE